jgi:hypothetical protein
MKWVPASSLGTPEGKRKLEGDYEEGRIIPCNSRCEFLMLMGVGPGLSSMRISENTPSRQLGE